MKNYAYVKLSNIKKGYLLDLLNNGVSAVLCKKTVRMTAIEYHVCKISGYFIK
jgi:hypothetical protein